MEDRRAHDRLDMVELAIRELQVTQRDNAISIRSIEQNTKEMVELMRGARGIMSIITILAKLMTAIGALYILWHSFITYIRGD